MFKSCDKIHRISKSTIQDLPNVKELQAYNSTASNKMLNSLAVHSNQSQSLEATSAQMVAYAQNVKQNLIEISKAVEYLKGEGKYESRS